MPQDNQFDLLKQFEEQHKSEMPKPDLLNAMSEVKLDEKETDINKIREKIFKMPKNDKKEKKKKDKKNKL